jgi:HK97 family phage major capsid protein
MAYALELRQKQGRVISQMQFMVGRAEKQGSRGFSGEEVAKYHALTAEHDRLDLDIKKAEIGHPRGAVVSDFSNDLPTVEQMQDEFRLTSGARRERERDPEAKAFSRYIRNGMDGMEPEDRQLMARNFMPNGIRNAQSTTTTQGGYLVPQGFSAQLEEAKKWFGGIEGTVGKFTTASGNPWPWPTLNDTTNKGRIIGQNVQVTETDLAFNQVTFNAYIGSSDLILVPSALMEDSYFDLDGLVAQLLGTRLGRLYNNKCTVGSGVGEPTGIVTAAITAGNGYQFPVGNTTGITYASLVNVEHSVDPAYRYGPASAWMFSDAQLKVIKLLVDGNNRPLWQPGLSASFREGAGVDLVASKATILDHPYYINQDMASPAASAYSLLFGDMSCFKVREVAGGTTVLRLVERYADYAQIGFLGFQRFDSNLIDSGTHPLATGQNSAS